MFIAGSDRAGNFVSGSGISSEDVALVGERLESFHDSSVITSSMASSVASAYLAKARLAGKKVSITISPHCGLELWDVVSVVDMAINESNNYRIAAYIFEYSVLESRFYHEIVLGAP